MPLFVIVTKLNQAVHSRGSKTKEREAQQGKKNKCAVTHPLSICKEKGLITLGPVLPTPLSSDTHHEMASASAAEIAFCLFSI